MLHVRARRARENAGLSQQKVAGTATSPAKARKGARRGRLEAHGRFRGGDRRTPRPPHPGPGPTIPGSSRPHAATGERAGVSGASRSTATDSSNASVRTMFLRTSFPRSGLRRSGRTYRNRRQAAGSMCVFTSRATGARPTSRRRQRRQAAGRVNLNPKESGGCRGLVGAGALAQMGAKLHRSRTASN